MKYYTKLETGQFPRFGQSVRDPDIPEAVSSIRQNRTKGFYEPRSGIDPSKPSCHGHYLADDFSIVVIPQLFRRLIRSRIRMNGQCAVFKAAAPAGICSITS